MPRYSECSLFSQYITRYTLFRKLFCLLLNVLFLFYYVLYSKFYSASYFVYTLFDLLLHIIVFRLFCTIIAAYEILCRLRMRYHASYWPPTKTEINFLTSKLRKLANSSVKKMLVFRFTTHLFSKEIAFLLFCNEAVPVWCSFTC